MQAQATQTSRLGIAPVGVDPDRHFIRAHAVLDERQRKREGLQGLVDPNVVLPATDRDEVDREGLIVAESLALRRGILE